MKEFIADYSSLPFDQWGSGLEGMDYQITPSPSGKGIKAVNNKRTVEVNIPLDSPLTCNMVKKRRVVMGGIEEDNKTYGSCLVTKVGNIVIYITEDRVIIEPE